MWPRRRRVTGKTERHESDAQRGTPSAGVLSKALMNRQLILVLGLLVVGLALSACARPPSLAPPQGLTFGDGGMYSRPEAHLRYPGSSVISQFSQDEYRGTNPFGGDTTVTLSARVGAHLAARDSLEEVFTWYGSWLAAHGWRRVGDSSPATWRRGTQELFVVSSDQVTYATDRRSEARAKSGIGYYAIYYVTPSSCAGQSACPASALPTGIRY